MTRSFAPLPYITLPQPIAYAQPAPPTPLHVQMDSSASDAMTDLSAVTAVIALAGDTVDEAHRRMIQRGVRLLLVVDQDRKVVGVITATDILGEKPVQIAVEQQLHRDEVLVRNIMTPCTNLQVLTMDQVQSAKVGHIVATLRLAGRQHTLVVDHTDQGNIRLRGIFSITQIYRQLDMPLQSGVLANTFAEIEAQLWH